MDTALLQKHRAIVSGLITMLPDQTRTDDRQSWTEAVKTVMGNLCKTYLDDIGYEYCGTQKGISREWLLDALWYVFDKNQNQE
jgi:hypothetical protein